MPNLTDNPGFTGNNNQNTNNGRTTMEDILKSQTEYLKSIDDTLKNLLKNGASFSQSAARDATPRRDDFSGSSFKNTRNSRDSFKASGKNAWSRFTDSVEDELVKSFVGSGFSDEIKKKMKSVADSIGVQLEDLPNELGKAAGSILSDKIRKFGANSSNPVVGWFKGGAKKATDSFRSMSDRFQSGYQSGVNRWNQRNPERASTLESLRSQFNARKEQDSFRENFIQNATAQINSNYAQSMRAESAQPVTIVGAEVSIPVYQASEGSGFKTAEEVFKGITDRADALKGLTGKADDAAEAAFGKENIVGDSLGAIKDKILGAGGAEQGLAGTLGGFGQAAKAGLASLKSFVPQLLVAEVGTHLLGMAVSAVASGIANAVAPAIEGLKQFGDTIKKTANRTHDEQDQMLKHAQERLEADVKTMVETPFKILEDAARKLYDVWDSNIREINQTQGYNKEDLQNLIGSYAQRLRDENLSSVVSSADITEHLTKVLESGLSGQVAEEFAYLATKLNAAIPTQDFFQYADAYASLAATAIQQGQSEAQAIEYANTQLESFANNILYASRQISGGFSTGLKNANELFEQSVKIAQTGRSTNVTEISGVMASVSAIVGAVAPDLASSMTDLIYQAATGGNTSQLVALRSLAGINASNTEFLREFTQNPKAVFTELFENLADMQQMSPDNYMEVAEGLADVFGVSMDALARVDFNYLAQAISEMNVNSGSLDENLSLLASGESTTSAEQMRMQQINQYMIDEGLAYVMDNEAARAIQEHMWEEQIANELMEATYGVELTGSAAEAIQGIKPLE